MAEKDNGAAAGGDDVIAGLRQRMEESQERADREREGRLAERDARRRAEARAHEAEQVGMSAHETAVTNALAAEERAAEQLEAQLTQALEGGNAAAAAKASRDLGAAGARIDGLKHQQQYLKNQREQGQRQPASRLEPGEDPRLEPYAAFPNTVRWIKQHPEFFTDPKFNSQAMGYHNLAVAEGLTPDTPEYFAYIEEGMGLNRRQSRDTPVEDREPEDIREPTLEERTQRARDRANGGNSGTSTAAPTGRRPSLDPEYRDNPSGIARRLTAEDEEAVQFSDPELYAKDPKKAVDTWLRNQSALRTEGRIGRPTRH
jgi:hypothetical protein